MVPEDGGAADGSVGDGVPEDGELPEEVAVHVVVAPVPRADLVRVHALLAAYESPFTCPGEETERREDVDAHERLRRYIGHLLE